MDVIKLGAGLGQIPAQGGPQHFWDVIDTCEREGIDSIWLSDRLVGNGSVLEPITALAAVAGRTRRMKFGPSVLVLPLRQPVVLAKEVATLDFLSKGRMLLAVGVGVDDPKEFAAAGVPKEERGGRLDEAMILMRRLWTEDSVTFHGRYFQCDDVTITPRPVQRGGTVPIWVGGRTEPALRRCARLADGWLPSFITPEEFASDLKKIHQFEAEYDREIEDDHFGTFITYHVAESREAARANAEPFLLRPRSRTDASFTHPYYAFGTANDVISAVERYVEAGATKFVLRPVCAPEQVHEQLTILGRQIIPHFSTAASAA